MLFAKQPIKLYNADKGIFSNHSSHAVGIFHRQVQCNSPAKRVAVKDHFLLVHIFPGMEPIQRCLHKDKIPIDSGQYIPDYPFSHLPYRELLQSDQSLDNSVPKS